jgi:hypothetical protein
MQDVKHSTEVVRDGTENPMTKLDFGLIAKNLTAENPIHASEAETHNEPTFTMKDGYIYQNGTNGGGPAPTKKPVQVGGAGAGTVINQLPAQKGAAVIQGVPQQVAYASAQSVPGKIVYQTPMQSPTQSPMQSPMQSPIQSPMQTPIQGPPMKGKPLQTVRAVPIQHAAPHKVKVTPQAKMAGTLDGIVDFLTHCVGGHISFLWKDPLSLLKDPVGALKLNELELNPMGHIKNSIYQAAQRKNPMQQLQEVPMGLDGLPGISQMGLKQSTMGGTMVNGKLVGAMKM